MKKSRRRILAVFFGGGEGVLGHALAVGVENLVAAPQRRVIALGGRLGGEVLHLGVQQHLLVRLKLVLLEPFRAAVALHLRAEGQVADRQRGRLGQLRQGLGQLPASLRPPGGRRPGSPRRRATCSGPSSSFDMNCWAAGGAPGIGRRASSVGPPRHRASAAGRVAPPRRAWPGSSAPRPPARRSLRPTAAARRL